MQRDLPEPLKNDEVADAYVKKHYRSDCTATWEFKKLIDTVQTVIIGDEDFKTYWVGKKYKAHLNKVKSGLFANVSSR